MAFIKDSRSYIEEIDKLKDIIFKKKHEKYEVGLCLKDLKAEAKQLRTKIDDIKKTQDEA